MALVSLLTRKREFFWRNNISLYYSYANSHHSYAFPRVMAMLGDGKTEYDLGNDGKKNSIAACSVRWLRVHTESPSDPDGEQAKVRRTDIATKLRITYFRDDFLQVSIST